MWIHCSLYSEKKATWELSGAWTTINFLHCQRTTQANCGERLFISPNTDESLLSVVIQLQICQEKKESFSLLSNKTQWLGTCKDTERDIHQGVDAISWKQNIPRQWHWIPGAVCACSSHFQRQVQSGQCSRCKAASCSQLWTVICSKMRVSTSSVFHTAARCNLFQALAEPWDFSGV